jgi:hypothetical protein
MGMDVQEVKAVRALYDLLQRAGYDDDHLFLSVGQQIFLSFPYFTLIPFV